MDFSVDKLKYRTVDGVSGLVLVIVQDAETNEVLMAAFANKEAIEKSLSTGRAHYYSTSRRSLWLKGETSGHYQKIREVFVDCDGDAILFKVEQIGAACHENYRSCFFRKIEGGKTKIVSEKMRD